MSDATNGFVVNQVHVVWSVVRAKLRLTVLRLTELSLEKFSVFQVTAVCRAWEL